MASVAERRRIARLVHRFGFGPKPGEFQALLAMGFDGAANQILRAPSSDAFADEQPNPAVSDQGPRPAANSSNVVAYATEKRTQLTSLTLWWLDRMALSEHSLRERMTWFWHGHWATSFQKVDDALPMYLQNQTLRENALGDFNVMAQAMVNDGALIYWLDGQSNTIKAPNENLSRELMELFILGVNRYSENDVRETAKALTGYRVNKTSGAVTFLPRQHFSGNINFLGTSGSFDAKSLASFLVSRSDCALFISERMWYRFISSEYPMSDSSITQSFAFRNIATLVETLGRHPALDAAENSMVKSPIDWFISVCRAFAITPSQISNIAEMRRYLENLGQVPFFPPNVGGWPTDQAWLSTSSAQYRIQFANVLLKEADLSPISATSVPDRVHELADLLGVSSWSSRTELALNGARNDPSRMALLAICSPEYVVSA